MKDLLIRMIQEKCEDPHICDSLRYIHIDDLTRIHEFSAVLPQGSKIIGIEFDRVETLYKAIIRFKPKEPTNFDELEQEINRNLNPTRYWELTFYDDFEPPIIEAIKKGEFII
jgi:hypothetical protein